MPFYKLRSEGEPVQLGDKVSLVSVKSGGNHFLRVSNLRYPDNRREVNVSAFTTKWQISRFVHYHEGSENVLKSGDVVRLYVLPASPSVLQFFKKFTHIADITFEISPPSAFTLSTSPFCHLVATMLIECSFRLQRSCGMMKPLVGICGK